ncbi:penicillin acylase family protein [Bacillus paralicheniformis]|nr:penicillin acylase family protein [Bacillus paralicheniformis]MEC1175414.1 penicillin acylase family protein [Bacillus paralicheniformis]MEC1281079.1 penicillin acylase family protein [Bacillus paralicheniformis]MEC1300588.1 penicillin acylase family protein [Bacillus paralicheniformis]MED1199958.1 penicillin acylase family protein [Bacillus paralicheniformis]
MPQNQTVLTLLLVVVIAMVLYAYLRIKDIYRFANVIVILRSKMPKPLAERIDMPLLHTDVEVKFDKNGVPQIEAASQTDAYLVLGFIMARDRLFQMDTLRRVSSGRMSEIFGRFHLENDRLSREIGFHRQAGKIYYNLDNEQKRALKKFAEGVNHYLETSSLSFEFRLCKYKPEPWEPKDSILVYLEIFRRMCSDGSDKRMITVMEKALPKEAVAFFTTDEDVYQSTLVGGDKPRRSSHVNAFKSLIEIAKKNKKNVTNISRLVKSFNPPIGSNHWAVSGKKTANGCAMLASDMHLELGMPNVWYRAGLKYGQADLNGIFLPGVPMMVAGSNGKVGWGFTRMCGDNLDLVYIEENPANPNQYKTPEGWADFEVVEETIKIKGGGSVTDKVRLTCWGPVCGSKLLGNEVALKWAALSPEGVDFNLIKMDTTESISETVELMNNWGGPPLNVMLADSKGDIAWTVTGKFPNRYGFEGIKAEKWADGTKGWSGFIPPYNLPSVCNPEEGFLVTANNRTIGSEYPYQLGFNFFGGYRAKRIKDLLARGNKFSEDFMHDMQLDTTSEFYEYYRKISLDAINRLLEKKPNRKLSAVRKYLNLWDGTAHKRSKGFPLLFLFHQKLSEEILGLLLAECRRIDPAFQFSWMNFELPLRRILDSQITELIPGTFNSWDSYFRDKLLECVHELKRQTRKVSLHSIKWGDVNRAFIIHPLSLIYQGTWKILNMKHEPLDGCPHCIQVSWSGFGVSERFVFSPSMEEEGVIAMPGGQSGHPLSVHYDDHHQKWRKGQYFSFKQTESQFVIRFVKKDPA